MPLPITEKDLQYITKKVYALYAKHGLDGISMDVISAQTGISKATLYRYFTSKEDIVKGMIQFLISHLDSVQFTDIKGIQDAVNDVREFYRKSILIKALTGLEFLTDLKHKFPDLYKDCYTAMLALQNRYEDFFSRAVNKGLFRDFPFSLVSRQYTAMLSTVIDMNFLEQNQIPLSKAIRESFRMFLCQILEKDYLFITDQEETYSFAPELADLLIEDFFIDSIRR